MCAAPVPTAAIKKEKKLRDQKRMTIVTTCLSLCIVIATKQLVECLRHSRLSTAELMLVGGCAGVGKQRVRRLLVERAI